MGLATARRGVASFLLTVRNRRDREWDVVIFEADTTAEIALQPTDVVRFKVKANDEAPILDLSSLDPAEITFAAGKGECVVKLTAAQIGLVGVGAWDCELDVYSDADGKLRHAGGGVLFVHPTQLGAVGGEESSQSQESSNSSSGDSSSSSF